MEELAESVEEVSEKVDQLMALVTVEDTELAKLDTDLKAAAKSLGDKIATLIAGGVAIPAGSLSAIQADLATLQGLAAPAPVTPPAGTGGTGGPPGTV